jgi:hypothetical protein
MKTLEEQAKIHKEWLKHPCTQDALKILNNRAQEFIKQLQDGVLLESNPEKENKLRTAITTLKASTILLQDTAQFVEHLNKK